MLDPENDPQPADPPDDTGGSTESSSEPIELDSTARKPADPPETAGGGG
jgi:hypothetical protein